jgi:hypothetical protein
MRSIVPGDYKLFAWEDIERYEYKDPEFLQKYEALGIPAKISESSQLSIEVKVIPVP